MKLLSLDPITDPRWPKFIERHPASSIFHTPQWLESLRKTYDYRPIAFTTSSEGQELQDGIVFAEIESWLTGRRLVSLPFSDHCEPLTRGPSELTTILPKIEAMTGLRKWKYVEIRPLPETTSRLTSAGIFPRESFAFHSLDLQPDTNALFKSFHKSCIQRKITRADREGLRYEVGRSKEFLDHFYSLLLITRRRHQLPPQPRTWFQNLTDLFGERLSIHIVFKDQDPVATILTIRHKDTLVYKYGCSDARFHKLGGMIHLFWKAVQQAKAEGLRWFDLGRSELSNSGLIEFKGHWSAPLQTISYFRFPPETERSDGEGLQMRMLKSACRRMPDSLLELFGNFLYRHVG